MLDLTDVLLNEGKVVEYRTELTADCFCYKFGRFLLTEQTPVFITVVNAGDHKLSLCGESNIKVQIPCARCLKPVAADIEVQFDLGTEDEKKDYIDGYNLDVDRLVHDEAMLVWPERILCREDCRGLCISCGQNLNNGSCDCKRTDLDPRMAKILDIFSNFKEV